LVYLVTASLAFYGVKGGIFVISTGGAHMVLGPPKSFLKTHGEIGMALAMTIPFIRYIQLTFAVPGLLPAEIQRFIIGSSWQKLIHIGLTAAMFLTAAAILGTHSRGAMLAAIATGVTILWKGRNKLAIALALALAVPFSLSLMPEEWFERMDTVTMDSEKQDASTTGRINAWWMGFNMANDRFLGGGFNCFRKREFAIYAPNPASVHEAHNNFIEVLAEHGWVGFGIFFVLGLFTWMKASSVARKAKKRADTRWLTDLTTMCQVSIAAYVVSGMFIGQAYFDLYYHVVAFVVLADALLKKELARQTEPRNVLDNSARARSGSWAAYGGASRG
jgi:probable O-glycosylation ligase (exosortase A-associated)